MFVACLSGGHSLQLGLSRSFMCESWARNQEGAAGRTIFRQRACMEYEKGPGNQHPRRLELREAQDKCQSNKTKTKTSNTRGCGSKEE